MKLRKVLFFILFVNLLVFSQDSLQLFLGVKSTKVADFWKKYPKYDGRGVIIFIFDTGVDQAIEGLKYTSTGETKVIDVVDFTGEGDCFFDLANLNKNTIEYKNIKLNGIDKIEYKAIDNKYYVGFFNEDKLKNSNSGVKDVNNNNKEDDAFPFVTFCTKDKNNNEFWVAYFDFNLNGDISDDKAMTDYKRNFDYFVFDNVPNNKKITFSMNIYPEEKRLNLHFDDGAHGTHCAGIAAGYKIGGLQLNGIAPGAKVISVKIGDNSLSGGATVSYSMKKAIDFANKISKDKKVPCVINMSYGIGSVIEGDAEIEKYLNQVLTENPYLYFFTSNGNEGPGLSTAGIPAASPFVFSSGAVLAEEVGKNNYGTVINRDIILHFSSRGGEVFKPDVVSPGAATSTVPEWEYSDKMWGTSMASPYSAGVGALLLSAAMQEFSDIRIPNKVLFDAIRYSAQPMQGYNSLDYGFGLIDVMKAYDLLKKYIKNNEHLKYQFYVTSTQNYYLENGKSQNVYVRNVNLVNDNEVFNVNCKIVNNKDKFYRAYKLVAEMPFIKLAQQKIYIRNDQIANIRFTVDKKYFTNPGLYVSKIFAYRDDASNYSEFSFLATFIKPYYLDASNNYNLKFENIKVLPGEHIRYFINIPKGATAINLNVEALDNHYSNAVIRFIKPDGQIIGTFSNNTLANMPSSSRVYTLEQGGVYEVVVHGNFIASGLSVCNLNIKLVGLNVKENIISNKLQQITVENALSKSEDFSLGAKVNRKIKTHYLILGESNKDILEYKFKFNNDEKAKEFKLCMSKADFNKFTDFSILIVDEKGYVVEKDGLNYNEGYIYFDRPTNDSSNTYTFLIKGAYATAITNVSLVLDEITIFSNDYKISLNKKDTYKNIIYDINEKNIPFSISKLPKLDKDEDYLITFSFNIGNLNFSQIRKLKYE